MTTIIVALLIGILIGVGGLCGIAALILKETEFHTDMLKDINRQQYNPRTRISTMQVQSGPVTEEQQVTRLGRTSKARRVVVGGDPQSEQHQRLVIPGVNDE